jgi:hypothetical protein
LMALAGGLLYASRKKRERFININPTVADSMGAAHTQYIQDAASRFNPLMNLINPANNPLHPTGTTVAEAERTTQKVKNAIRSVEAKPSDPSFVLGSSDTSALQFNLGSGGPGSQAIKVCESIKTLNCDAFDDPNFSYTCGMCHKEGRNSQGEGVIGGLFVLEDDKLTAEESQRRMGARRPNYTPSVGTCAAGHFTTTKQQCLRLKKKMECEVKQTFDSPGCSQCFQDSTFQYIDEDAIRTTPNLVFAGSGSLKISKAGDKPFQKTVTLSNQGTRVSIPDFIEGDSVQLEVSAPENAALGGYLEGNTGSGVFVMDISRLLNVDMESGKRPRMVGSIMLDGGAYNLLRPAAGKNAMRFSLQNTFTFLDSAEEVVSQCASSPFIQNQKSAEMLESGPCFAKGSGPGKYSKTCLQEIFLGAGCETSGTGYPATDEKAAALMVDKAGRPLDIGTIGENVYTASLEAYTGKRGGEDLIIEEWNRSSQFCTGKSITSPCDGDNKQSGPLSTKCLSYLWENRGTGGSIGPTYTNTVQTSSGTGANIRYCTTKGTLSPVNSLGQTNQRAVDMAKAKGGVASVKTFYDQIHKRANDNSLPDDARKEAIQQCYGADLAPLAEGFQGGALSSVLDYKPGRTQSPLIVQNFNPFGYEKMFPVAVLTNVGQSPWRTWGNGAIPTTVGAKWIWDNPNALWDDPGRNTRTFYYVYKNVTNQPLNATIVLYVDNRCSAFLVNNQNIGNQFEESASFPITLAPGDNKIQINAENLGGPAGIAVQCKYGSQTLFVSNEEWKIPYPQPLPPPPPPKVFKRANETDPNCCGGGGGGAREMICPEGAYVKSFYGGAGTYVDRIGLRCSNGLNFGPFGGGGGAPYDVSAESGFNKLGVKTGSLVDNIRFFSDNREIRSVGGGGGGPNELNCGDGKIMGLKVRTGSLVDRIQAVCGKEQ